MERYFKRKSNVESSSPATSVDNLSKQSRIESSSPSIRVDESSKSEFNLADLPADPGLRPQISIYDVNIQEEIRRTYMLKGPCQPREHNFPQKLIGKSLRRFNPYWFDEFGNWLEYSIAKDSVFCLCCYLFSEQGSSEFIVGRGFSNWKKKEKLQAHVGGIKSSHNQAWSKCQDLLNQRQHIETLFFKQSEEARNDYNIRLNASIDCIRFLLHQGLSFRGHDESETSSNPGNFLQLLTFLANHNGEVKAVALKNAPDNLKLTSPEIQKDIVKAYAMETTNVILQDLGNACFSILVDESRDVSTKEQMGVALRYVDKRGYVIERFLGIKYVSNTSALSLKASLEELFSKHGLSISSLRGQGYDGASNMQGEFNGLKTLIMKENECAYYVHCFAHQLQLALVAVAKDHVQIASLFSYVALVVNVVGGSCKRQNILRDKQAAKIVEALDNEDIQSGQGLNQETTLKRSGDTRWGSHYGSLTSLIIMFSSVIDVLEIILKDGYPEQKGQANALLELMQSFEFVFTLHLMKSILGITNELSEALQRNDQDIVNAMILVQVSKQRLQIMREIEWESLLDAVSSFCDKHDIEVPNMDDTYLVRGRLKRRSEGMSNLHHFRFDLFNAVIDMQLQELNNRFNVANTELLLCVACLNPSASFSAFDKQKLIRLAQFYPRDFTDVQLLALSDQLENYIIDMRSSSDFSELKGISALSRRMVETKRDKVYYLLYKLLTLALLLPVATATVERAFSAMKIVKNRLRNRMGNQWLNDCMVVYIEKDVSNSIDNKTIMDNFQTMKNRRGHL